MLNAADLDTLFLTFLVSLFGTPLALKLARSRSPWKGVINSVVVLPLQNAFLVMGDAPLEVAAILGVGTLDRFFSVILLLAKPGFLTVGVLGFAHTAGEFGSVMKPSII